MCDYVTKYYHATLEPGDVIREGDLLHWRHTDPSKALKKGRAVGMTAQEAMRELEMITHITRRIVITKPYFNK